MLKSAVASQCPVRRPTALVSCQLHSAPRSHAVFLATRASKEAALRDLDRFKTGLSGELSKKQEQWQAEGPDSSASRWRLHASAAQASSGALQDLNKDTFQPFLDDAGEKLVHMVKFNCNKGNKEMGKELGIKVAPTFHLYKKGEKVAEMTGAKVDELRALIDKFK
ncbi:hypothetical protein WJX73_005097 [Symbiochloris irregularis]|uniref:Thioredoxin domain-containing protein n=1 Tax=Symbiochloris irregularis TaxID=706552 RepID=A0AAW1P5B6_9CHLO